MKKLWNRSTTRLDVRALPPERLAAIREQAELYGFDDPVERATHACTTRSESLERKRLFGKAKEPTEMHMLLADPLLVVLAGDVVSLYRLGEIDVAPFRSPLVEDVGLEVTGVAVGATERATRFLPLDEGPAGAEFRAALVEAARR